MPLLVSLAPSIFKLFVVSLDNRVFAGSKCYWIFDGHWSFGWEWKSDGARYMMLCVISLILCTCSCLSQLLSKYICVSIPWGALLSYILQFTGRNLSMLPVEPKLGKMLLFGAIFNCLDPIMTVVAGLSARDPFLMPFDKKDVSCLIVADKAYCIEFGCMFCFCLFVCCWCIYWWFLAVSLFISTLEIITLLSAFSDPSKLEHWFISCSCVDKWI